MKKLLLLFFIPAIFLIPSCKSEPAAPNRDFFAKIYAEYRGSSYEAELRSRSGKLMSIKLISPKKLKGLSYTFRGGEVSLKRYNLKLKADRGYLPSSSAAVIIYDILSGVDDDNPVFTGCDNSFSEYKGKLNGASYTMICEYDSGVIRSIEVPKMDFKMKLSEIRLTE